MQLEKSDFKRLLVLAVPLLLSGLVESSIGFVTTIFLARLGPQAIAAGSLTVWFFATLMVVVWGVLVAVSTLVSRYHGANDTQAIRYVLRDAIWFSLLLTIPCVLLVWHLGFFLSLLGQSPALVSSAAPYLHALAWGLLPDFLSLTLLQFIIGLGQSRTYLFFTLVWVPINISLSYVLVFGKWGFPAFGIAGIGWGASLAYTLTLLLLVSFMILRKCYRPYWSALLSFSRPQYLWQLITIGLPMGVMYCLEIGYFFALAILLGNISITELAANQVTMQYVGFFVTLSFSIAQAVTVRMGNQIGARHPQTANRAVYVGLIYAFGLTLVVAIVEWIAPRLLLSVDFNVNHPAHVKVVQLAIQLLSIAAIFQLSEAIRITLFGALRALKDTRYTLVISALAFWGIAIPFGFALGDSAGLGAIGYWWALVISGIVNAVLLYKRYCKKIQMYL